MTDYPPYVNAYGKLSALFEAIKKAEMPSKFNIDFLEMVLGFKSSSDRAFVPFLKRLGLVDSGNVPTKEYALFRDNSMSGAILASLIRQAYTELYRANQYVHRMKKDELMQLVKRLTGASENDGVLPAVIGTFQALVSQADFETNQDVKNQTVPAKDVEIKVPDLQPKGISQKIGLAYTINLNLPATTNIEVFNAIFKSLKENLLDDKE